MKLIDRNIKENCVVIIAVVLFPFTIKVTYLRDDF